MRRWIGLFVVACALAGGSAIRAEVAAPTTRPATAIPAPKDVARHEQFLQRISEGPIGVAFFGDSITDGWRAVPDVWNEAFGRYDPANFGISGDGTQHVLWRMLHGELEGYHPRVVVLMIGTNNMGAPAGDIVLGVSEIVQTVREKQPDAKILLLAIFPRQQHPDALREKVKQVNEQLAKLADGQMVRFLDIGAHFVSDDGTISPDIMPDFLHLSQKGYEIWARQIGPTLEQMMK
jgi:lysophospholipase L1-like esterase